MERNVSRRAIYGWLVKLKVLVIHTLLPCSPPSLSPNGNILQFLVVLTAPPYREADGVWIVYACVFHWRW